MESIENENNHKAKHNYCHVCSKRLDCLKPNVKKKGYRTIKNDKMIEKLNILKPGMEYGKYACLRCINKSYKQLSNEEKTFTNYEQTDDNSKTYSFV